MAMSGVAFRVLFGLAWLLWVIALLGAGSMFYFPFVIFKVNIIKFFIVKIKLIVASRAMKKV
jgi:uncharacterized membrane protein YjjP (DUF1212 family)